MSELGTIMSGIFICAASLYVRPASVRIALGAAAIAGVGAAFTIASGEYRISWLYALSDTLQVAAGYGIAASAVTVRRAFASLRMFSN
ncbi:MAG: hypothetical protein JO307_01415 [Bryobacterales bacterium]|nr:hypothetical protein [Bryobacterales bacterium]